MNIHKLLVRLCSLVCLSAVVNAYAAYNDIVFFGDSLTDIGNNGCNTNQPSSTVCPTWAYDLYGEFFPGKTLTASNAGGMDYAISGQTTNNLVTAAHDGQIDRYLQKYGKANPGNLYIILMGGNDIMGAVGPAAQALSQKIVNDIAAHKTPEVIAGDVFDIGAQYLPRYDNSVNIIVNNLVNAVNTLTQAGAQNILVMNVPDVGQTPPINQMVNMAQTMCSNAFASNPYMCSMAAKYIHVMPQPPVQVINDALAAKIATLKNVRLYDLYSTMDNVLANYQSLGFTNATDDCNGDSHADCATYVFWDGVHPTAKTHGIMADRVKQFILGSPATY